MRRHAPYSHEPSPVRRRPRRRRIVPTLLMLIGAGTVFVLCARYLIVPLLVWLGGVV